MARDADAEEAVLGDALQAAGDPFGLVIALRRALSEAERDEARQAELSREIARVLRREREALLGPLAPHAGSKRARVSITWASGYATGALLRGDDALSLADAYAHLAALPFARDVRALALEGLAPLPDRLDAIAGVDRLSLRGACVTPRALALLRDAPPPRLRHLVLSGWLGGSRATAEIARLPALARLETLALSACGLEDHDLASLALRADAFAHLEVLDLSRNTFSRAARARAAVALPNATF